MEFSLDKCKIVKQINNLSNKVKKESLDKAKVPINWLRVAQRKVLLEAIRKSQLTIQTIKSKLSSPKTYPSHPCYNLHPPATSPLLLGNLINFSPWPSPALLVVNAVRANPLKSTKLSSLTPLPRNTLRKRLNQPNRKDPKVLRSSPKQPKDTKCCWCSLPTSQPSNWTASTQKATWVLPPDLWTRLWPSTIQSKWENTRLIAQPWDRLQREWVLRPKGSTGQQGKWIPGTAITESSSSHSMPTLHTCDTKLAFVNFFENDHHICHKL